MKDQILAHAKAVTALVTALLLLAVQKLHLGLSPDTVLELGALVVTFAVYAVPNKQPSSSSPGVGGFKVPEDTPTKPYGLKRMSLNALELASLYVVAAVIGLLAIVLPVVLPGCGPHTVSRPEPPSVVVAASCTAIEALTDNGVVDSVCAKQDEIGQVLDTIASMRASQPQGGDEPARRVARCKPIPGTKTCATNAELLAAIRAVKAARATDGGT